MHQVKPWTDTLSRQPHELATFQIQAVCFAHIRMSKMSKRLLHFFVYVHSHSLMLKHTELNRLLKVLLHKVPELPLESFCSQALQHRVASPAKKLSFHLQTLHMHHNKTMLYTLGQGTFLSFQFDLRAHFLRCKTHLCPSQLKKHALFSSQLKNS